MSQNGKLKYYASYYGICVGAAIGVLLPLSSNQHDFKLEHELQHSYTSSGRSVLSSISENTCFDCNDLQIVCYNDVYYLTDVNLKWIGSKVVYQIVEDPSLRGKFNQILSNDVIPFQTIVMDDKKQFTLEEAYDLIDDYCYDKPLPFPEKSSDIVYSLNDNPCDVAWQYSKSMKQDGVENLYKLENLYVVYKKGNVFLCQEISPRTFGVIYDGENFEFQTICFFVGDKDVNSWVRPEQIKKLSNILSDVGFYGNFNHSFSIDKLYQLLSSSLKIVENPFVPRSYFSSCFTKDQKKMVGKQLEKGYSYLDYYHFDYNSLKNEYYDGIKIVRFADGQYVLIHDIFFDSSRNCYYIYPLSCYNQEPEMVFFEDFEIMRMDDLLDKMHAESFSMKYASDYYHILSDYLIKYGDPFEDLELSDSKINFNEVDKSAKSSSEEDDYMESTIQELGRKLELKLTYPV